MLLAAESTEAAAEALKSGWFLDHAWLVPIIPAVAFALNGAPTSRGTHTSALQAPSGLMSHPVPAAN